MRLAIVHTATTPELEEAYASQARSLLGNDVEMATYRDPSVLADVGAAGYVTTETGARYLQLILQAAAEGADVMFSTCCVMADVVREAKQLGRFLGTPIVSIEEGVCTHVAQGAQRVLLAATSPIAAASVLHTLEGARRSARRSLAVEVHMAASAGAADVAAAVGDAAEGDLVLLAQPSMAGAAAELRARLGCDVEDVVRLGMAPVARALAR